MGRWQPLTGDPPAEVVRLVRELRRYVDRCEMNTATVAAKTGYSRSSWLRYLNGRRLPPWEAVAELGRLAQADAEHLRVLWESAAHAWSREDATGGLGTPPAPRRPVGSAEARNAPVTGLPPAADPPYLSTRARRAGVLTAAAAACSLLAAVLLAWPWSTRTDAGRPPDGAPSGAPAWPWPLRSAVDQAAAACRLAGCRGLDPYREGCDRDGVAVHRLRAYGHVLTLQYSPACLASWAEVDTPVGTAGLRIATTGGDQQAATTGGAYTAMVGSGPDAARATVVVDGHQLGVARYDSWIDAVTGSE
ncbi:helix-turn-helix domain-containing protein [Streptomyces hyaluromycini]|uniref:helix-turn-helix domain-containing protein n=1 Tax=Streptomyces hyaluromycini TaxID=1377993 RepID=UPI00142E8BE9|nr:XRE family transcriptional regulator [Streptomyces hyaluromycini]